MRHPARALLSSLVLVLNTTACGSGGNGGTDEAGATGGSSGLGGSGASAGAGGTSGGSGGSSAAGGSAQGGAGAIGGNGGAGAAGGMAGAGAAAGIGGGAGMGATSGAGGVGGSGGTSATGGSGGAGIDCDALLAKSGPLLEAAQACSVSDAGSVCTDIVDGLCCPAVVANRFSDEARTYIGTVKLIRDNCDFLCPAIPCDFPVSGECSVGDGGVGMCLPL